MIDHQTFAHPTDDRAVTVIHRQAIRSFPSPASRASSSACVTPVKLLSPVTNSVHHLFTIEDPPEYRLPRWWGCRAIPVVHSPGMMDAVKGEWERVFNEVSMQSPEAHAGQAADDAVTRFLESWNPNPSILDAPGPSPFL